MKRIALVVAAVLIDDSVALTIRHKVSNRLVNAEELDDDETEMAQLEAQEKALEAEYNASEVPLDSKSTSVKAPTAAPKPVAAPKPTQEDPVKQAPKEVKEDERTDEEKRQEKAKFDEVNALMKKYDDAENAYRYANSPEFEQKKEDEKLAKIKEKEEAASQKKLEAQQAKEAKEEQDKVDHMKKVEDSAEQERNAKFIKSMTTKFLTKAEDASDYDRKILTKDQGYKAIGKILAKVKHLTGLKQSDFMDKYFTQVWFDHDKSHNNFVEANEVESLFEDIMKSDAPEQTEDDDY